MLSFGLASGNYEPLPNGCPHKLHASNASLRIINSELWMKQWHQQK
jgi:hypothetical protein